MHTGMYIFTLIPSIEFMGNVYVTQNESQVTYICYNNPISNITPFVIESNVYKMYTKTSSHL